MEEDGQLVTVNMRELPRLAMQRPPPVELPPDIESKGMCATAQNSLPAARRRTSSHGTVLSPVGQRCQRLSDFVNSQVFESLVAFVIIANCITMGIQAELLFGRFSEWEAAMDACDHIFTCIFLVELALRVLVFGFQSVLPNRYFLNFVDALLVFFTGVLAVWILPLLDIKDNSFLRCLTILRALRLMRLARIVRKVDAFHEVWLLIRGLGTSFRTLLWTIVVVCFVTYVFAIFGVVLISVDLQREYDAWADGDTSDLDELREVVFVTNSVSRMMFTLIQVLTLDSWNGIARPMSKYIWWSWAYFYAYIAVAVIVLMNLVTAVIVENALNSSKMDEEQQLLQKQRAKEVELGNFRALFELIDSDSDGVLTWEEFAAAFENPDVSIKLELLDVKQEDLHDLFALLDTGDGSLSLQEFFEGITRMEGAATAKDVFRIMKTTELVAKLIVHHAKEVSEDLTVVAAHTPGLQLPHRQGSLKTRSLGNHFRRLFPDSPMSMTTLKSVDYGSVPAVVLGQEPTAAQAAVPAQGPSLQEVSSVVEKLSRQLGSISEQIDVVQAKLHRMDNWEDRLGRLATDVSNLSTNTARILERVGGASVASTWRRGVAVPCCAAPLPVAPETLMQGSFVK
mmetsp:Transcript_119296/g.337457  ORF Transcript_119296/g.337457 Transcript_119296/m.337457 type:complete len:625 (-) Transcript_119296:173-2047(-)